MRGVCWARGKKNDVLGPACISVYLSVIVNFGGNSGARTPQLPNCKTKEVCGNSKCPAVFPHPSSGETEPDLAGPGQSILRPSSKQRRR